MGRPLKESIAHSERDRQKAITRLLARKIKKIKEAEVETARAMKAAIRDEYFIHKEISVGIGPGVIAASTVAPPAMWETGKITAFYTQEHVDKLNAIISELEMAVSERDEIIEACAAEITSLSAENERLSLVKPVVYDADGWIEWRGGENPLPVGTRVDVKLRNLSDGMGPGMRASSYRWTWGSSGRDDIIAYRICT